MNQITYRRPFIEPTFISAFACVLTCVLVLFSGCRPFAEAGESCTENPCAVGLQCVTGICMVPPDIPEPAPPCEDLTDCLFNGSTDGRSCEEGTCVWISCSSDGDCGTRVCDEGVCTERTVCVADDDCKDGQICDEGACRSPCVNDEDCAESGLDTCVEGRCYQSCFIDLLCFGGICEDGICVDAECEEDLDCGEENVACENGRCISFLGCEEDEDCFDPDYYCNELNRCEERPGCQSDAECGPSGLCLGGLCRDALSCFDSDDCETGQECIGEKCVSRPECRSNIDCSGEQICVNQSCADPSYSEPSALALQSPFGVCESDGTGACRLQLFPGERFVMDAAAFDETDAPILADLTFDTADPNVATIDSSGLLSAVAAGTTTVQVSHTGGTLVHTAFEVEVLAESAVDSLRVLVVDALTGLPVEGALIYAGLEGGVTDVSGLYVFDEEPTFDPALTTYIGAYAADRGGFMVLDLPLTGDVRLPLPSPQLEDPVSAGFSGTVTSTGDELGSTGIGVALPCLNHVSEGTLDGLFSDAAYGAIEVPLLGAVPVEVPANMMYETSLPLAGNQVVRDKFYTSAKSGRCVATALESRNEGDGLGELFGGATAIGRVLDLASTAEGMDILLQSTGRLEALPMIVDGAGEGIYEDFDNDGNLDELVPNFSQLPELDISPSRAPTERVGVRLSSDSATVDGDVFVALGLKINGVGFVTTGIGRLDAFSPSDYQQVKVVAPDAWAAGAKRQGIAELLYSDSTLSSVLLYSGPSFAAKQFFGDFLSPPEGTFALEDLPTAGSRLLILPTAGTLSAYDVDLETEQGRWRLIVPSVDGGGRSVGLPTFLASGPFVLNGVAAIRLTGDDPTQATLDHYQGGGTFTSEIRHSAIALSEVRPTQ